MHRNEIHLGLQDPLFPEAHELIVATNKPSVAYLQRHFQIGYNRALAMMTEMEGELVSKPLEDGSRRMLQA